MNAPQFPQYKSAESAALWGFLQCLKPLNPANVKDDGLMKASVKAFTNKSGKLSTKSSRFEVPVNVTIEAQGTRLELNTSFGWSPK